MCVCAFVHAFVCVCTPVCTDLASLLPSSLGQLQTVLQSISAVSVYTVNLEYCGQQLPVEVCTTLSSFILSLTETNL